MSNDTNEPTAAIMEMLTPGSIWKRKNGVVSRFLFLTNDSVPAEHQDRFPQMAVYADDDGNVLSLPLEDFLGNRKFHHVDGDLEQRLLNLLDDEDQDEDGQRELDDGDDNDGDDDAFDIDGDDDNDGVPDTADIAVAVVKTPFIAFTTENPTLPAMIDPLVLARAVIGYNQAPQLSNGRVSHTLLFETNAGFTAEDLHRSFSPSRVELNQVFSFTVNGPEGQIDIDWDEFAGVYTGCSAENGPFWSLVFYTKLNPAALEDTDADAAPDFVVQQDGNGKNVISVAQNDNDTFVIDETAPADRAVFQLDTGDKPASPEQIQALVQQFQTAEIDPVGKVIQASPAPVAAPAATGTLADDPAPAVQKPSGFMIG